MDESVSAALETNIDTKAIEDAVKLLIKNKERDESDRL